MAALAVLTAASLALLGRYLAERNRLAFWLTLALLGAIIVVIFFDQVGPADLIVVALTGLPLVLLLRSRSWYLGPSSPGQR
jgi:hypothetical protein